MRLENKVAIVTGGASGIGLAVVELFAREGAKVVIADLNENVGYELANRLKEAIFIKTDVTNEDNVKNLMKEAYNKYGKIDIHVNCAGVDVAFNVTDTTEDVWNKNININLKSVYLTCKYVIPYMIENGGGSIVNTASILGIVASHNQAAYCASKAGIIGMSRQIAYDYGDKNIRVNCICPGDTMTPMNKKWLEETEDPEATLKFFMSRYPLKRFAEPIEQANVILFLASEEASFITGQAIPVDGGLSIW